MEWNPKWHQSGISWRYLYALAILRQRISTQRLTLHLDRKINMSSCPWVLSGEEKLNDSTRMENASLDRTLILQNIVNRNGKGITLLYLSEFNYQSNKR